MLCVFCSVRVWWDSSRHKGIVKSAAGWPQPGGVGVRGRAGPERAGAAAVRPERRGWRRVPPGQAAAGGVGHRRRCGFVFNASLSCRVA